MVLPPQHDTIAFLQTTLATSTQAKTKGRRPTVKATVAFWGAKLEECLPHSTQSLRAEQLALPGDGEANEGEGSFSPHAASFFSSPLQHSSGADREGEPLPLSY
jgi:hypothetical protein